tara:strand:+ start:3755 stop:4069 length:315 start_codon:yes stop_codon:yes gene_type:complete
MELLWFSLACYGLTFLVVYASVFNRIRPKKQWLWGLGKLFHCPLCFGFHAGWFFFVINEWTELFTFDYTFANFLICACVGAGTSYTLSMIVGDEGIKVDKGTSK